jgi:hypothetical protein
MSFCRSVSVFSYVLFLHSMAAASFDCSGFFLADNANVSFAYRFINDANVSFSDAAARCRALHPQSQLAIIRNRIVAATLARRLPIRMSYFIGLNQSSKLVEPMGNWIWTDGVSCSNNDPTDTRCYQMMQFDNLNDNQDCGGIAPYWTQSELFFDDTSCSGLNPFVCEVPSKRSLRSFNQIMICT